jgi:hypothetical protein
MLFHFGLPENAERILKEHDAARRIQFVINCCVRFPSGELPVETGPFGIRQPSSENGLFQTVSFSGGDGKDRRAAGVF